MKKILVFIALSPMLTSCGAFDLYHSFVVINESDEDVYAILDTEVGDNVITVGSIDLIVEANSYVYFSSTTPWEKMIKDYAYIYIIDASLYSSSLGPMSEGDVRRISDSMVLSKIILPSSSLGRQISVVYPGNEIRDGWPKHDR